jgi:hypothetical protein
LIVCYAIHFPLATRYYYIYGDVKENIWSAEATYLTVGFPSPVAQLDFFIFGDLGQVDIDGAQEKQEVMPASLNTTLALAADLTTQRVAFHIGDISYARGYMTQWENFFGTSPHEPETIIRDIYIHTSYIHTVDRQRILPSTYTYVVNTKMI